LEKCSGFTSVGRNDWLAGPLKARTVPFHNSTA
jgi:hypothetical protein